MRLLMTGCEYAGVRTLTRAISEWGENTIGGQMGDGHHHFRVPHLAHPPDLTEEEQQNILALSRRVLEIFQRYNVEYHLQSSLMRAQHHIVIGMHIDEAVYAPLYYGYGREGEYAGRVVYARYVEDRINKEIPDLVHVLVKASPEVIAARMKEDPHDNGVLKEKDIELVLGRFEEEYERPKMANKITIETTSATVEESLAEFVQKVQPFLSEVDRTAILVKKAEQRGEWI